MKITRGTHAVPVIYTAHHASHNFNEFDARVALLQDQKIRYSDYGTDKTVPKNGIVTIVAESSRALGDLNRAPDHPNNFQEYDYAKPESHKIWNNGQELTIQEKEYCRQHFHKPFHAEIVHLLSKQSSLTFVIAWDNTAHYRVGKDADGEPVVMKPFILSNRGEEEVPIGEEEQTSCDPLFMSILSEEFSMELKKVGLPSDIHLNLVMQGGYICQQYSTRRNKELLESKGVNSEVQSLQLEYDASITHDQITLEPITKNIANLRMAFSNAIEISYKKYTADTPN